MSEETAERTESPAPQTPKKPRPQGKKPRPRHRVNGITIPHGAVRWRVHRFPDATGKSREGAEPCAVPGRQGTEYEGRRIEWFPVKEFPPSWDLVLAQWGSGTYRIQFWGEEGTKSSLGWSAHVTFDDPNHPQLPTYRGAPAAPPPAAEAPAPAAVDPMQLLLSRAEAGKIDAPLVAMLFQMQQAQMQQQREWYAEREREDRRRRQEIEDEHQRRMQARQVEFEQERKRAGDYWAQESERALKRVQEAAATSNDDDDRFDDLAEAMTALAEKVETKGKDSEEFWEKMVDKYIAPLVVARMSAGGTPPLGNGGPS